MLGTKHSTQNKLCWILLLELSDSRNSAVFLLLLVWLSIRRFFLRYCSSFSEKPQILLFYWYILVFLSALSPKSNFRMLMLLRPFPALGNLFKSLLLFMDIKYCQKNLSCIACDGKKEASFEKSGGLVEMAVRSLWSDYLKMLSDILIWTRSLYMFSSAFFVLVPIKKLPVCLFPTVYFLHPDRNKGNDPFSFPSLSLSPEYCS